MVKCGRVSATDFFQGPVRFNIVWVEDDQNSGGDGVDDPVLGTPLALPFEEGQPRRKPWRDLGIQKVFPVFLAHPTKIKLRANPVDGSRGPFGSMFNNAGTSFLDRDIHASGAKAQGGDERPISN